MNQRNSANRNAKPHCWRAWATALTCAILIQGIGSDQATAQPVVARQVMAAPVSASGTIPQKADDQAVLKTDADLEALLTKAERYLEEGNYRIATRIWQEVMSRSGDTLFSTDGEIYYSIGRQVEKRIAQLPPEGLQTYRISADAGATEILAASGETNRSGALNRILNEYFLSSLGDDAALDLASQLLDQCDFVGANRLLQRIIEDYPDPSVSVDQVWARIAVCQAYSGNHDAAAAALKQARALATSASQATLDRIAADLKEAAHQNVTKIPADQLALMRLGNPRRSGVMPELPVSAMATSLRPAFEYRIEPKKNFAEIANADSLGVAELGPIDAKSSRVESDLYKRWQDKDCFPTGYLLIDEHHVYYKSIADVAVWDKNPLSIEVAWRPAWLNQFIIDDGTRVQVNLQNAYGVQRANRRENLTDDPDVFFFGDHVAQSMSVYQGVFYNVEGPSYDISDSRAPRVRVQGNFQWGEVPRRTRTNFLTAYDARTGQLKWRVPAPQTSAPPKPNEPADGSDAPTPLEDIGFMGAPIGYGSLLIVPVNNGGSIYVYALDIRQEGKVVWKSFLTDEPPGGASFWSPIQLSLEGSDLFALCGSGALFVLEPATGGIRFARRYPRTGKYDRSGERFGMSTQRLILDGWSEDIAIPYRNLVLVLASDLNMIHAYDRQDGKLKWEAPTSADADARVNYLLGVHDDLLFAGGPEELIAYDLKGEGRMLWTASWTARDYLKQANAKSFGRGMVTPGAVYLPIKNSILKLDLKTGKPVASASVQLGYDGPVGNLFSDGQRFWVVSANRVMALENVSASDDKQSSPQDSDDKTGDGEESDGERGLSTTDEPNRANGS